MADFVDNEMEADIYICSVCLENMLDRKPRTLRCNHSFCEPCLRQILEKSKDNNILCPTCRFETVITDFDVDLPINFTLQKFKEYEKELRQLMKVKNCKICKHNESDSRCLQCDKHFCFFCRQNHEDSHSFIFSCGQHKHDVTHICEKCIQSVCDKCAQEDHRDHPEELVEFHDGVKKIKQALQDSKDGILKIKQHLDEHTEKAKQTLEKSESAQAAIVESIEKCSELTRKTEDTLLEFNEQYTEPVRHVAGACQEIQMKVDYVIDMFVKADDLPDMEVVAKYNELKEKSEALVKETEANLQIPLRTPVISVKPISELPDSIVSFNECINVQEKDGFANGLIQVLDLTTIPNMPLKSPDQVMFLSDDIFAFNDWKWPYISCLDLDGSLVARLYGSHADQPVVGMTCWHDYIYIVQSNRITKTRNCITSKNYTHVLTPCLDKMSKLCVVNEEKLIITSIQCGTIHEYNPIQDKLILRIRDLQGPSGICVFDGSGIVRFIVTEKNNHLVRIYDEDWEQVVCFGGKGSEDGKLKWPSSVTVSSGGNITVADWGNSRISLFNINGQFLQHLLTEKDSIKGPMGVSVRSEHLLVTEQSKLHCAVKIFRFQ